MILTFKGNHEVMNKNNVIKANKMFQNGIRVFLYPGMSHIKASNFDGWACLGTANFDKLSFRDNLEMNLAISHPEAVRALHDQVFAREFEKSVEMTELFPTDWSTHLADILADRL